MKKIIIALFALLAVFACNRNELDLQPSVQDQEKDNTPVSFNLSVNAMGEGPETKAALKADWNNGDVVYVFFDAIPTKYVKKTFDGSVWTDTYPGGDFVAGDFSASGPAASRNMTAVWFPQGEVDVTYADSKFSFTIGGEKIYSHYMSVHAAYSISGTTVSGTLDMEKPAGFVQFFVPGIAAADAPAYRLMESHLTPKACDYVALAGGVNESALTAGYSLKGMAFTTDESVTGALFGGYLSSAGATTSYKFSLVKGISADKPAAEGTYTLLGYRNIAAGTSMTFPTIEGGAWGEMSPFVYLGFGDIQWATGNLKDDGTIVSPVAAGDYYQWGAIKKHGEDGGDFYSATEELPASRDIASLRSSGAWHMPSKTQFDALSSSSNTKSTWVTGWTELAPTYGGRLITSKVNGISLFFPAKDDYGRYWSTTPSGSNFAYYLLFNGGSIGTSDEYRYWGVPVRPITGAPTPAPDPWDGDLSKLDGTEPSGFTTATNGMTITGTLSANVKISIDPGATVTLNNATIDGISINNDNSNSYKWAGITCNGDATIILNGNNSVAAFYGSSGIYIPSGSTLTIQGPGSLTANGRGTGGAGIGVCSSLSCGNIRIEGGTITAIGGTSAAGIGGGAYGDCGDITITGGTITASGGAQGCGIGSGASHSCGDITISGGTITATGGDNASGIGSSTNGACGNILINGGTVTATATVSYGPGIGCGPHYSSCSSITITSDVTRVTATKAPLYAPNSIGAGGSSTGCGPITIGGVVTGNITTSPFVYHGILNYATAEDVGNVVCAAGHLHIAKNPVPAGCTAVGILGKVTSTGHGLILALKDATSQTWNTIDGWSSVSYAGTTLKVLPNDAARGSLTSYTTLGSTTVSNWSVAQQWDYSAIFHNLGSTAYDGDDYTYDDIVNAHITSVGGDALSNGSWSASAGAGGGKYAPAYSFHAGGWNTSTKSDTKCVRPVLGF